MVSTPLKKLCIYCLFSYAGERTTCETCGAVLMRVAESFRPPTKEADIADLRNTTLCCPTIGCPNVEVPEPEVQEPEAQGGAKISTCPECKTTLEFASIYLWLDKIGRPTPKDLADFLRDSSFLRASDGMMKRAATSDRLSLKEYHSIRTSEAIEEVAGRRFDVLEDWARESLEHRTRYKAIERARRLRIDENLAGIIFDQLVLPLPPASQAVLTQDGNKARKDKPDKTASNDAARPPLVATNPQSEGNGAGGVAALNVEAQIEGQADETKGLTNGIEDGTPMWQSLREAASYITPWEYIKKICTSAFRRMHTIDSRLKLIQRVVILFGFVAALIAIYEFSEHRKNSEEERNNQTPVLTSIKCKDTIKAGEPLHLEAEYQDDQEADRLKFDWKVEASDEIKKDIPSPDNKPAIELNMGNLKNKKYVDYGIITVNITLKIRDPFGKESEKKEKTVRIITNRPPATPITRGKSYVEPGDKVLITAMATDPDGDKVTYDWDSDPHAKIDKLDGDGSQAELDTTGLNTSTSSELPVTISIYDNDGTNEPVKATKTIIVGKPKPIASPGAAASTIPPSSTPITILVCQALKNPIHNGEMAPLTAVVYDPLVDDLIYKWTTDAGRVSPANEANPTLNTEGVNSSITKVHVTLTLYSKNHLNTPAPFAVEIDLLSPEPLASPSASPTTHSTPTPSQESKPKPGGGASAGDVEVRAAPPLSARGVRERAAPFLRARGPCFRRDSVQATMREV